MATISATIILCQPLTSTLAGRALRVEMAIFQFIRFIIGVYDWSAKASALIHFSTGPCDGFEAFFRVRNHRITVRRPNMLHGEFHEFLSLSLPDIAECPLVFLFFVNVGASWMIRLGPGASTSKTTFQIMDANRLPFLKLLINEALHSLQSFFAQWFLRF